MPTHLLEIIAAHRGQWSAKLVNEFEPNSLKVEDIIGHISAHAMCCVYNSLSLPKDDYCYRFNEEVKLHPEKAYIRLIVSARCHIPSSPGFGTAVLGVSDRKY